MEVVTADVRGEIVVYECPECGYQEETLIEHEDDDDEPQPLDVPAALDEDYGDDGDEEPPMPDGPA